MWIKDLFLGTSGVAHAAIVLALVIAFGLMLGSLRLIGLRLGVAGVLFVGLAFGHFHVRIDQALLEFARDFGLILFVYTIGIQVGPGFLASLRKRGLPLNLMAAANVLGGAAIAVLIGKLLLPAKEFPVAVGLFSGATTSTPSLAAAQQALTSLISPSDSYTANMPALGYAVAYPFGVIGIILTMYLVRILFRIDTAKEIEQLALQEAAQPQGLRRMNVEVKNPNFDGVSFDEVMALKRDGIAISRVMHDNRTMVPSATTVVSQGDVLLAVGPPDSLEHFRRILGDEAPVDLKELPSSLVNKKVLVTQAMAIGKSVQELKLGEKYGVSVSRITRADIELPVGNDVKIQFGDRLTIIGEEKNLKEVAKALGDSVKKRDTPMLIPMFLGIAAGVLLGSVPINLPGFPAAVTLGLAGGPLIMAIILSRIGRIGPFIWYMPKSANLMVREIGIVLFLACIGLKAGSHFVQTLIHGDGFLWMGYGAIITAVPLVIVGVFARAVAKLNYAHVCGLLAGSMTDTAALSFAIVATGSDSPSIAYSTIYPLTVLLRVLFAQAMIMFFFR